VTTVFILWHSHPTGAGEMNEKLIGVYATEDDANGAIRRFKVQPGERSAGQGLQSIAKGEVMCRVRAMEKSPIDIEQVRIEAVPGTIAYCLGNHGLRHKPVTVCGA
jgi:hypothetical protein